MAVANPRHATFLPGRLVPLFSEARAPLRNAFAAEAAKAIPDTAGFSAGFSFRALIFRININSAPPTNNDACTDVRCARSSSLAVPCHAIRFALRAPRCRKSRGDSLCSRACTVSVISLSVCRICSRSLYAVDCRSSILVFSPILPSPSDSPSFAQVSFPSASGLCALSEPGQTLFR